jgi:hypothetical protein
MNHPEPFVQGKKAPAWCTKPKPCDFDPPTSYCPHRECRELLLRERETLYAQLAKYLDIALPKGRPSCLVCGRDDYDEPAIKHLVIGSVVVCPKCFSAVGKLSRIQSLVNEQAEDEGLWAVPIPPQLQPISEAYLQQELRRLHAEIEKP